MVCVSEEEGRTEVECSKAGGGRWAEIDRETVNVMLHILILYN